MKDLFTPLTEQELDRLDAFLLDRIDDDEDAEDKDEGIFDISTLDGFMTAIVSGPRTLPPSQWLPAVWGDFEPIWESKEEFEEIFSLMVRHMNVIAATLIEAPEEFEPMFLAREVKDKVYLVVDEWCEGYLRGVRLNLDDWISAKEIGGLLDALILFASEEGWQKLDRMTEDEVERLQRLIAPAARDMHAYWNERRGDGLTVRRNAPKVGRNDPCPCRSGKKFKKCCGAGPTIH
jgi:yecA family protein